MTGHSKKESTSDSSLRTFALDQLLLVMHNISPFLLDASRRLEKPLLFTETHFFETLATIKYDCEQVLHILEQHTRSFFPELKVSLEELDRPVVGSDDHSKEIEKEDGSNNCLVLEDSPGDNGGVSGVDSYRCVIGDQMKEVAGDYICDGQSCDIDGEAETGILRDQTCDVCDADDLFSQRQIWGVDGEIDNRTSGKQTRFTDGETANRNHSGRPHDVSRKAKDRNPRRKVNGVSCVAEDHVPQDHVPQDHVPQDHLPQDHVPQDRVPQDRVPQDRVPQDRVPQNRVPQDRVPQPCSYAEEVKLESGFDIPANGGDATCLPNNHFYIDEDDYKDFHHDAANEGTDENVSAWNADEEARKMHCETFRQLKKIRYSCHTCRSIYPVARGGDTAMPTSQEIAEYKASKKCQESQMIVKCEACEALVIDYSDIKIQDAAAHAMPKLVGPGGPSLLMQIGPSATKETAKPKLSFSKVPKGPKTNPGAISSTSGSELGSSGGAGGGSGSGAHSSTITTVVGALDGAGSSVKSMRYLVNNHNPSKAGTTSRYHPLPAVTTSLAKDKKKKWHDEPKKDHAQRMQRSKDLFSKFSAKKTGETGTR